MTKQRQPRRRRWTDDQRRQILGELDASGLSVAEFAKRVGINFTLLYGWRRRLGWRPVVAPGSLAAASPTPRPPRRVPEVPVGSPITRQSRQSARNFFTAVRIVDAAEGGQAPVSAASPPIVLMHGSGWSIQVGREFDADHLGRVMHLVASRC